MEGADSPRAGHERLNSRRSTGGLHILHAGLLSLCTVAHKFNIACTG